MRFYQYFFFLFTVLASSTFIQAQEAPAHHSSIVEVHTSSEDGSGVLIAVNKSNKFKGGFEGYVLTAWHVVNTEESIEVSYKVAGRKKRAIGCRVIVHDEDNDLAILRVWVPQGVEAAEIAEDVAQPEHPLEFVGFPASDSLVSTIRTSSAIASDPSNPKTLFADTSIRKGQSGGPVFNDRQQVVGIISRGWFIWNSKQAEKSIQMVWPAKASNLSPIKTLVGKIGENQESTVTSAQVEK